MRSERWSQPATTSARQEKKNEYEWRSWKQWRRPKKAHSDTYKTPQEKILDANQRGKATRAQLPRTLHASHSCRLLQLKTKPWRKSMKMIYGWCLKAQHIQLSKAPFHRWNVLTLSIAYDGTSVSKYRQTALQTIEHTGTRSMVRFYTENGNDELSTERILIHSTVCNVDLSYVQ